MERHGILKLIAPMDRTRRVPIRANRITRIFPARRLPAVGGARYCRRAVRLVLRLPAKDRTNYDGSLNAYSGKLMKISENRMKLKGNCGALEINVN